jgi:hypothetical protein
MSNNKAKELTVNYIDLDISRISATDFEENERSKGQKIAYAKYDHPNVGPNQALMVQFPWVKLNTYGVPRAGEYFKTDADRAFVKLPLDSNIPEISTLVDKIKGIDALFSSETFASKMLGKKWAKYTYQPIFREAIVANDDDSDEETTAPKKVSYPRPPYIKLKIDTEYGTNTIKTQLFKSEMINNKRTRTEVIDDMKTVDDFAKLVSYQSNFRPIARLVKFWAQPLTKKDPMWGATFKIIKAEVEPSVKGGGLYKEYMNSDAFLDSEEEQQSTPTQVATVKVATPVKKVLQVESDEDESSEEKPKVLTKPVQPVAQLAQDESDDDDDESDEKPIVQSKVVKKIAQVDSESDEEQPIIHKKAAAPVVVNNSDSDEPAVKQPIKKVVKKTTSKVASHAKN